MTDTNAELPMEIDVASVRELLAQSEPVLLVDCREQNEYDLVRIDGARLIAMSEIEQRIDELEPHLGQRIVVHCHYGGRSLQVAEWLRQRGFSQAQSMAGGIDQWAVEIDSSLPRY